ncbi:hypothetical protein Aduo_018474 [Ancylostoma duodenale]
MPFNALSVHEAGHRLAKSEILKRSHVAEEALPLIDPNEVAFLHTAKLQKMATVGQAAAASASAITTPNSLCSTPVSLYPQHQLYQYMTANPFANQFCEVDYQKTNFVSKVRVTIRISHYIHSQHSS